MYHRLLFLSLLALVSCGESPLFNHDKESPFGVKDTVLYQGEHYDFKNSGFSFSMDWAQAPHMGSNSFVLRTWKSDAGTINGPFTDPAHQLHVFLWMPSMGHGSSPVKIKKLGSGEFEVNDVYFIMGGKWEVKVQLLSSGKVVDEVSVPFDI